MFSDRYFLTRFATAAVGVSIGLTALGAGQARAASHLAAPRVAAAPATFSVLHSFSGTDGSNPQGGLVYAVALNGSTLSAKLVGAAQNGGANDVGSLFSQDPHVAASFADVFDFNGANGAVPSGGLAGLLSNYSVGTALFGATATGGKFGFGAIYEATANGAQTLLYSFTGTSDGANPVGRLLLFKGALYGTTSAGAKGFGTIFRFTPQHGLSTLHRFTGGNDGAAPLAGLALRLSIPSGDAGARATARNGNAVDALRAPEKFVDPQLYGTTSSGGAGGLGGGTLFKISTGGKLTTLFTFLDSPAGPGATPSAELQTDFSGNLYGTTLTGGSAGLGEVFVFDSHGAFNVVHDFAADPDSGAATTGANPLAPLTVAVNGALYGSTSSGSANGLGNIFRIDANGFALKYEFSGLDGASPQGQLVDGLDGNLYGTTFGGGANGLGEIFSLPQ